MLAISTALAQLTKSLALEFKYVELNSNSGFDYEVRLKGMPEPYGFSILVGEDYMSWWLELKLDTYSKPLLELLSARYPEQRIDFDSFVAVATSRQSKFNVDVNGISINQVEPNGEWGNFNISASSPYQSIASRAISLESLLFDVVGTLLLLLATENIFQEEEDITDLGAFEGSQSSAQITKYERSRINRKRCLDYFGFKCQGCGLDMENIYGPIGNQVIHVHHIVPVSQMGGSYRLNPIKDLIPLCPNCHNVVHRTSPPITISDLREATGYRVSTNS